MSSVFDRLHSQQRKWYLQPIDPMSAEKIYKLTNGNEKIYPTEAIGPPEKLEKDGHLLVQASLDLIESLMGEMSINALNAGITDFGLNFYVYAKDWNEQKPRYRFASTWKLRRENGIQHKNQPDPLAEVILKKVPTKQKEKLLPTFTLRKSADELVVKETQPTPSEDFEDFKKTKRFNYSSTYRISTHQKLALSLLIDELAKIEGATTEPIPNIMVGPNKKEPIYSVPSSVVLEMKIKAKHKFLDFCIWKKNDKGGYVEIERYPHVVKNVNV